jgi:hypothetical protein
MEVTFEADRTPRVSWTNGEPLDRRWNLVRSSRWRSRKNSNEELEPHALVLVELVASDNDLDAGIVLLEYVDPLLYLRLTPVSYVSPRFKDENRERELHSASVLT